MNSKIKTTIRRIESTSIKIIMSWPCVKKNYTITVCIDIMSARFDQKNLCACVTCHLGVHVQSKHAVKTYSHDEHEMNAPM
jgi:hypothetical protein